jgi:hypothetical protein
MPLPRTRPFLLNSTLIPFTDKTEKRDSASGFFYKYRNDYYIITNLHVIEKIGGDDIESLEKSDNLELTDIGEMYIYIRHNQTNEEVPDREPVDILDSNGNPRWISHSSSKVDVVALPVGSDLKSTVTGAYSKSDFVPNDIEISAGDSTIAVGYPKGIYDSNTYLPVIRNGLIATPPKVDYKGLPMFLMDAKMHGGTSGSPVLTQPSPVQRYKGRGTTMTGESRTFLLGIHSGPEYAPSPRNETVESDPSLELNMVWRIELLEEMLAKDHQ